MSKKHLELFLQASDLFIALIQLKLNVAFSLNSLVHIEEQAFMNCPSMKQILPFPTPILHPKSPGKLGKRGKRGAMHQLNLAQFILFV